MIEVTDLKKVYSSGVKCCGKKKEGTEPTDALTGTNFHVVEHECFSLLGENGAGKSTSFKILTNEENPTSGEV